MATSPAKRSGVDQLTVDQMSALAHACRKFVREYEARSDHSMWITLGESGALFDLRYEIHKIDEALS